MEGNFFSVRAEVGFGLCPALAASTVALLLTSTAIAEPWWHNDWSHRIRVHVPDVTSENVEKSTGYIRFPNGGHSRADGGDIRVVMPGAKRTPHYVLNTDPATYTELFFKAEQNGLYWIYFGNKNAEVEPSDYLPEAGLSLHFYKLGKFPKTNELLSVNWHKYGQIDEFPTFTAFVKNKGERLKSFLWPKIEFESKELVPSPDTLLVFHGRLVVPEDGEYSFSIASDDPAAIVFRGAEFAEKVKPKTEDESEVAQLSLDIGDEDIEAALKAEELKANQGAGEKSALYFKGGRKSFSKRSHATTAHSGSIHLTKGIKEMFYYQTVWQGVQFASMAWSKTEKGATWSMMSADHFVQPRFGEHQGIEARGKEHSVTFDFREINTYLINANLYIEVEFAVTGPEAGVEYQWDFGDGVTGVAGEKVSHVYLQRGVVDVKASALKDGNVIDEFTMSVRINGRHETAKEYRKTIERYAEILRAYPFDKLPSSYFQACMNLFERVYPEPGTLVKVLQAHVETHQPVKGPGKRPGEIYYYAMPGKRRISSRTFESERNKLADFVLQLAEWYYHPSLRDSASALRTYQRLLDAYSDTHPVHKFENRGTAHFQSGKIYFGDGELDKADDKFRMLEEEARGGLEKWYKSGGRGKDADRYRYWIRAAMVSQADVALRRNDLDRMEDLCRAAHMVQRIPLRPAIAAARRASYRTTVEDLLRRAWPKDALDKLHLLEVEFPKNKLTGETEFLRGKAYFNLGRYSDARQSFALARRLLNDNTNEYLEMQFLDADALFWIGDRASADAAFKKYVNDNPESPFTEAARRRLQTVSVIRHDAGREGESFLKKHTQYKSYPLIQNVEGWGGDYRFVPRYCVLEYEFPVPVETERIRLRFRKFGVALVLLNDVKLWQEPHSRRDEGVFDQELMLTDKTQWASGKIKFTFRDGLNYWPYWDPVSLFVDWIELELLKLD